MAGAFMLRAIAASRRRATLGTVRAYADDFAQKELLAMRSELAAVEKTFTQALQLATRGGKRRVISVSFEVPVVNRQRAIRLFQAEHPYYVVSRVRASKYVTVGRELVSLL